MNTQIQVMFSDRKYVSMPLASWADDQLSNVRRQEGVSDVKMADAAFSGRTAKKITYREKAGNYDKTKSVNVYHEDYYIVEPAYAVSISTYVPDPDATKARPEMEKILKGIELK